jgi:hypothetical protein
MPSTVKTRRITIEMLQTSVDRYNVEIPDDMTDDEALELFQERQVWVYECHDDSTVEDQQFCVRPGEPSVQDPIQLVREP